MTLGMLRQSFPELRRLDREGIPLDSKDHEDSGGVLQTAAVGGDGPVGHLPEPWHFPGPVRPDPALPAMLEPGLLSMEHNACFLDFLFSAASVRGEELKVAMPTGKFQTLK